MVTQPWGKDALGGVGATSGIDPMARVRDEVLPDVAMYRSQLINTLREWGVPTASLFRPHARVPCWSAAEDCQD